MSHILRVEVNGNWFISTISWNETNLHTLLNIFCSPWLTAQTKTRIAWPSLEIYFHILWIVACYFIEKMHLFLALLFNADT
jgi:hypothetical protein